MPSRAEDTRSLKVASAKSALCLSIKSFTIATFNPHLFVGTFQDIDPKVTGVLRPDDIPMALSVAAELMDAKLGANR
jgi:hypothetical protein